MLLFLLNRLDDSSDAVLGQRPPIWGQASDQPIFQALVNVQGAVIIAEDVRGQGESQLRRSTPRESELEPAG